MKEVLKYIDECSATDKITTANASRKLKIDVKEIETVFMWLIENGRVIDCSSKRGMEIAKKRGVDYLSLSESLNNSGNNHKAPKIITMIGAIKRLNSIWKIIILIIIAGLGTLFGYILIEWYKSCFVVV